MDASNIKENLITHEASALNLFSVIKELKQKIIQAGDRPDTTVSEQLDLLEQLSNFGFGQCLIVNRGITGSWTRHMVLYPRWRKEFPEEEAILTPLNRWLLERSPVVLATQQRFIYFQKLLAENIQDNIMVASIPCGVMDDLLTLNLSNLPNVQLVGIDLDKDAILGAKQTAKKYHLEKQTSFIQCDAWQINIDKQFDMLTSNGLNFYESNDDKVVKLYKQFYSALKKGGKLITSFLTPPPFLNKESPWDMEKINPEDLRLQKVIFSYMLSVRFQAYRTEKQTIDQLTEAGFENIKILYDNAKIFPTVLCQVPS